MSIKKNLIDTNLIIRFLLADDPIKAERVANLLQGSKKANFIPDMIIAEIIWVLSSYYQAKKADIIEKIRSLIHVKSVECNKKLLDHALLLWGKFNISFVDAYLAALAQLKELPIYSYDLKFDKVEGVERREP